MNCPLRDFLYLPSKGDPSDTHSATIVSVVPTSRLLGYYTYCTSATRYLTGHCLHKMPCSTSHRIVNLPPKEIHVVKRPTSRGLCRVFGLQIPSPRTNFRSLFHKNDGQERRDLLTETPQAHSLLAPITCKNWREPIACSLNGRQPKVPITSKESVLDFYSHHTELYQSQQINDAIDFTNVTWTAGIKRFLLRSGLDKYRLNFLPETWALPNKNKYC